MQAEECSPKCKHLQKCSARAGVVDQQHDLRFGLVGFRVGFCPPCGGKPSHGTNRESSGHHGGGAEWAAPAGLPTEGRGCHRTEDGMQAGEDRSGPIIQCSDQAFTRSPLQNGEATETGTPSPDHANLRSRSLWQQSAAQQGTLVEPTWRNEAGTLLTNCPVKEVDPLSRLCSCIKGAKRGRPVTRLPTRLPSTVKALQPSQSQGGNRSG